MPVYNITNLRNDIRLTCGIGGPDGSDVTVRSDAAVDLFINFSYMALLEKYAFREKEVVTTLNTIAGVRNHNMPDPHDGLRQIDILDPVSEQHTRLIPMTVHDYTSRWNEADDQQAFPTHYVRESCLFRLWPTPDAVYKLTVRYWGILADLSDQNNTIDVPTIWYEPIKYGAIARCFISLKDFENAAQIQQWQTKLIEDIIPIQTKEEEDYHEAGVEVRGLSARYSDDY